MSYDIAIQSIFMIWNFLLTAWKTSLSRPLQPPLGEDIILQDIPSMWDSLWNWWVIPFPQRLTKLYDLTRELLKPRSSGQLSKWSCFTRRGTKAQCRKTQIKTTLLQYFLRFWAPINCSNIRSHIFQFEVFSNPSASYSVCFCRTVPFNHQLCVLCLHLMCPLVPSLESSAFISNVFHTP